MSLRFVVHEHHSSRLHFDFRLEMGGVLRSWAIPKGPSMNPSEKRLAIQVEDHQLEYIDFEGIIPDGQYGAGPVVIWDSGEYEPVEQRKDMIRFSLGGRKLRGGFSLVHLRGRGKGNEWLLIKEKDEYAKADWKLEIRLTPQKKARLKKRIPPCQAC
jgi:bifunctional non-homologous end joining protein LigD